jgi:hypothetical protein
MNDGASIYTSKSYLHGKIYSSVLFTRLSAMKSLQKKCYETITSLLQYMFEESNIITIEIPEDLKHNPKELTYGKVRDFLLFNSRINLISIGVYAINTEEIPTFGITTEDREKEETLSASINRMNSISDSDDEFSISQPIYSSNMMEIYDQFISELKNTRTLIMHPFSDHKLHPKDYII